jgi:glycosidase
LLNHYRSLIKLRGENPVLSNGEIVLLDTDNPGVYAVLRSSADQKILVVVNLKEAPISNYQLSLNESLLSDGTVTPRSLFGTLKAIPVTITGGKFSGYKPLNGLLPYELYIFEFE